MKRVLVLEPYYGGSHRHFLEGLQHHVPAQYQLMTLPARKWKMRMQLAAPWFVDQLKALPPAQRSFAAVLCSSYVDVAVLRALLVRLPGWDQQARICLYFHENQLAYPERQAAASHQFAAINFHSALAADAIAFNSSYNAETFLGGCRKYLRAAAPEVSLSSAVEELQNKSCILYPGIELPEREFRPRPAGSPVVVWNHRWEHDKNPEGFCAALTELDRRGLDFRLIVAGQSFHPVPACFTRIRQLFAGRLLHFGYVPSYRDYLALLAGGDLVVSTALHEFYGIAVIEAVRAGCRPLLPDRLSYRELFDREYLYGEGEFVDRFAETLQHQSRLGGEAGERLTDRFGWPRLAPAYRRWLFAQAPADGCSLAEVVGRSTAGG